MTMTDPRGAGFIEKMALTRTPDPPLTTGIINSYVFVSADTIVYTARILFMNKCSVSCYKIVRWFSYIDVYFLLLFLKQFYEFYILTTDFCLNKHGRVDGSMDG